MYILCNDLLIRMYKLKYEKDGKMEFSRVKMLKYQSNGQNVRMGGRLEESENKAPGLTK